jgi:hypothetical protein
MPATSQVAPVGPGATRSESSWREAFDLLNPNLKTTLSAANTHKLNILNEVLAKVENSRQTCIRKQWRVKISSGTTIVLRDVVEKMARWINRYKDVGTIAVQYDPVHAALPWAAFCFLLDVTLGDIQNFASLITDLELIAFLLSRCSIYEKLYVGNQAGTLGPLHEALVHLYAEILTFLATSITYFDKPTGGEFGHLTNVVRLRANTPRSNAS